MVAGTTSSRDRPSNINEFARPVQAKFAGEATDGFVFFFSSNSEAPSVTYIGTEGDDRIEAFSGFILVGSTTATKLPDSCDEAYGVNRLVVTGETNSPNFPLIAGAHQSQRKCPTDAFIARYTGGSVQAPLLGGGNGRDRLCAGMLFHYRANIGHGVSALGSGERFISGDAI